MSGDMGFSHAEGDPGGSCPPLLETSNAPNVWRLLFFCLPGTTPPSQKSSHTAKREQTGLHLLICVRIATSVQLNLGNSLRDIFLTLKGFTEWNVSAERITAHCSFICVRYIYRVESAKVRVGWDHLCVGCQTKGNFPPWKTASTSVDSLQCTFSGKEYNPLNVILK